MTMRAVTMPLSQVTGSVDPETTLSRLVGGSGLLFTRNDCGVVGHGTAAVISADEAASFLAAIEHDDRNADSSGPVALGALDFLPDAPANLIVPAVTVRRDRERRTWVTLIDGADIDPLIAAAHYEPPSAAGSFTIGPQVPIEDYLSAVLEARDAVRRGELIKAVIARPIEVRSDQPIDIQGVLRRLEQSFASSYRYCIDGLIGASPELLVAVEDDRVRSHPLAGTAPRTGDPETDRSMAHDLIASTKDQLEHRVVIESVHDTLLPFVSYLDWQPEPSIIEVANVQHLGSEVMGQLSRPRPGVIELVRALLPTPALGGHPRREALELIARVEGFERGRYGGAVGWVDGRGNGEWAVTIRCAELSADRRRARLVAGGGIVAESDPERELAETQAKLQAMLSAVVRP